MGGFKSSLTGGPGHGRNLNPVAGPRFRVFGVFRGSFNGIVLAWFSLCAGKFIPFRFYTAVALR